MKLLVGKLYRYIGTAEIRGIYPTHDVTHSIDSVKKGDIVIFLAFNNSDSVPWSKVVTAKGIVGWTLWFSGHWKAVQ